MYSFSSRQPCFVLSVDLEDSDAFDTDLDDSETDSGMEDEEPRRAPNELLMEVSFDACKSCRVSAKKIQTGKQFQMKLTGPAYMAKGNVFTNTKEGIFHFKVTNQSGININ